MTKKEQAKQLMQSNDWKGCFKIVKTFYLSISKDDAKQVGLAYECIVHPNFYSFRGQEWIDSQIQNGKAIVEKMLTA